VMATVSHSTNSLSQEFIFVKRALNSPHFSRIL
jgi:hypothetical protein